MTAGRKTRRVQLRAACFLLAACALLARSAEAQARPGSIYDPSRGPIGLISNKIARAPGDIITIVISENTDVTDEQSTDLSRSTNLNYKINLFDIAPDAFDPLPRVDADSTDGFLGSSNYQKRGSVNARISAVVVDALPNGNLVVSARREVRLDDEVKLIEFTGIVRRYDIEPDNSVQSELVAEVELSFVGAGPMTRTTKRYGLGGFLHRAWAWIWPF
jgi:flagellar L-ring protein precursor FlgH